MSIVGGWKSGRRVPSQDARQSCTKKPDESRNMWRPRCQLLSRAWKKRCGRSITSVWCPVDGASVVLQASGWCGVSRTAPGYCRRREERRSRDGDGSREAVAVGAISRSIAELSWAYAGRSVRACVRRRRRRIVGRSFQWFSQCSMRNDRLHRRECRRRLKSALTNNPASGSTSTTFLRV